MLRETFAHDLRKLQDEVLRVGSEVEQNLMGVIDAFLRRDQFKAKHYIQADEWVNEMRIDIGMRSLRLIATQQPAAGDMRLLAATIEIIGELERIHDYIKGIGKISLMIGVNPIPTPLVEMMPEMAKETQLMLHDALAAFSKNDEYLAKAIPLRDDVVDKLYMKSYTAMIGYVTKQPEEIETANRIEWAAHNLERAADRVINICEWVVYMANGVFQEMD